MRWMETAWERTPRARSAAMAATPAQLRSGSLERRSASWGREGEVTEAMETVAGGREGSMVAVTVSPREREASATAQPRKSKPGPRLATVAGAKAVTDLKAGAGSATLAGLTALRRRETSEGRDLRVDGKDGAVAVEVAAAAAMIWSLGDDRMRRVVVVVVMLCLHA
uniref:Uncharacterized protein n=1 Tax=Arundo donax TaxID=35708 RepID=A0A0A9FVC1_ARUDO